MYIFSPCGGGCSNTTTVFCAGSKERPKGTERGVWEDSLYYFLQVTEGEGRVMSRQTLIASSWLSSFNGDISWVYRCMSVCMYVCQMWMTTLWKL